MPPTYYNSCFRHGVDEKRRVQIPAKWRPEKDGHGIDDDFLAEASGGQVPARFAAGGNGEAGARTSTRCRTGDANKSVLKRFIGSESAQVALDKAGRICLPEDMARAAGIKDEAMLVGLLDRFEIWNPARYEKVEAADAVLTPEAFETHG